MSRGGRRAALAGFLVLAGGLAWLCIGFTTGRSLLLVDGQGRPIAGAYAAFHYRSTVFNFVDSLSVRTPGTLLRSDAGGRLQVPGRLALKHPAHSQPEIRLDFLYAPQLRNATGIVAEGVAVPRVFDFASGGDRIVLHDLEAAPMLWERSLDRLYSAIRFEFWPSPDDRSRRVRLSDEDMDDLVEALRGEYAALLKRHVNTPRQMPSEEDIAGWPQDDRNARLARVRADLDALPSWGDYLTRHWSEKIEDLSREWAALRPGAPVR